MLTAHRNHDSERHPLTPVKDVALGDDLGRQPLSLQNVFPHLCNLEVGGLAVVNPHGRTPRPVFVAEPGALCLPFHQGHVGYLDTVSAPVHNDHKSESQRDLRGGGRYDEYG